MKEKKLRGGLRKLFSAKGYLFTISVILFASTLVLYSQAFAEKNYLDERLVIESIKFLKTNSYSSFLVGVLRMWISARCTILVIMY
jgi:hypothetical protein